VAQEGPDFNREVRPVLARNCFPCHGPDAEQRQADLRLDSREAAVQAEAIDSGVLSDSELLRRILSSDPDQQMPPLDSGHALTGEQKTLLQNWVLAGARYRRHWAFVRPQQSSIPAVQHSDWPETPIDRFLLARMEQDRLQPSVEADRYTLIRRVSLDLIGLPPTEEDVKTFVNDRSPHAWAKVVDRLLASRHYGERWGRLWLDLARYSDTNGYEKDRPRSIWPYRDWVIDALNSDMPFDRFTIEQLAGDMLPDATRSQRIATGFHRNTMLNEEGGIDPNEYRFYAMVDRVATTGSVWLGLTVGCAQCHSHKYDPISHTDYYRIFALLNNADEPDLPVPDEHFLQRRNAHLGRIEKEIAALADRFPPHDGPEPEAVRRRLHRESSFAAWLKTEREQAATWHILRPHKLSSNLPELEVLPDGSIFSSGDITKRDVYTLHIRLNQQPGLTPAQPITALRLEVLPDDRLPAGGPGRAFYEGRKGDFFLSEFAVDAAGQPLTFQSGSTSFGKLSIGRGTAVAENVFDKKGSTGWSTSTRPGERHQLVLNFAEPVMSHGDMTVEMTFERHFAASLGRFRISATTKSGGARASAFPVNIEALLTLSPDRVAPPALQTLKRQFLLSTPHLAEQRKPLDALRRQIPATPHTMVLLERPADNPRETHRHQRGEYLSPQEKVSPALPGLFPPFADGIQPDRLSFARWLVSRQNPLVARVTVNRAWRAFFGTGLVETSADFGTQSNPPSHPELLDWLAVEFMSRGWSLKKLHRLIVTSAAYRQSSRLTPGLLQLDPENRLLARGPRFRVDAETVRDIMLRASGLLTTRVGGPSVYPPQPAGVSALAYGRVKWTVSTGADRYRRSLYTFNRRTAPFAAYTVFDGPTGETCLPRRNRSNTPLQALTLLNDDMYQEMVQALGQKTASLEGDSEHKAIWLFQRFLTRGPSAEELRALLHFQQAQLTRLEAEELDATQIGGADTTADTASWIMLARAVMNLDEVITRR